MLLQGHNENTKISNMKIKIILNIVVCVFLFSAGSVYGAVPTRTKNVSQKASAKSKAAITKKTNKTPSKAVVKTKKPFESALEKIKSDDPVIRRRGAVEFSRLRDNRAIDPLVELLKDESASVRSAAIDSLGLLRAKKALVKISKLLLNNLLTNKE